MAVATHASSTSVGSTVAPWFSRRSGDSDHARPGDGAYRLTKPQLGTWALDVHGAMSTPTVASQIIPAARDRTTGKRMHQNGIGRSCADDRPRHKIIAQRCTPNDGDLHSRVRRGRLFNALFRADVRRVAINRSDASGRRIGGL